jgi:AAA15 family ATPase/GTPase
MIRSITLQNFKSFGESQTVPLEPITVLVGPNNSGKSNFMSVGRFTQGP